MGLVRTWCYSIGLLIALAATSLPAANNITWTNAAGGNFQTPGNWNSNTVPGTGDVAVFDLTSTPYTVTWSAPVTNTAFQVNRGTVTWNLGGCGYYYSNAVACMVGTASVSAVGRTLRWKHKR